MVWERLLGVRFSRQAELVLHGTLLSLVAQTAVLWDLSWHHTPNAGDLLGLPHPLILPHFVVLAAVILVIWLPLHHLQTTPAEEATRDGRATLRLAGQPRSMGALLALFGALFAVAGLLWDGYSHVVFGRDGTHWTPSHLVAMSAPFLGRTGFLLLLLDELQVLRDHRLEAGARQWLQVALVVSFAAMLGAVNVYLSPWLQRVMPSGFAPLSAAGFTLWLVAAASVMGARFSATLVTIVFLAWRELASLAFVLGEWDRPPHLGALLLIAVAVDGVFWLGRSRANKSGLYVVAGLLGATVYALPAYVLSVSSVVNSSLKFSADPSRLMELTRADGEVVAYTVGRVLLVLGTSMAAGAGAALLGHWYATVVLRQRRLAARLTRGPAAWATRRTIAEP